MEPDDTEQTNAGLPTQRDGSENPSGKAVSAPRLSINRQQQNAIDTLAEANPEAVLGVLRQWMQDPKAKSQ